MADDLKERAERSSLDHMYDTAGSALAIGASALLFYRSGGRSVLSKGFNSSSRALGQAREEYGQLDKSNLGLSDLKDIYNRSFRGSESAMARARADQGPIGLRFNNQNNLAGSLNSAYSGLVRDPEGRFIRPMFDQRNIIKPMANELVQERGGEAILNRNLGEFVEESFRNLDDLSRVLNRAKELKVDEVMGGGKGIQAFLQQIKERKKMEEPHYEAFKRETTPAINQAIDMAQDVEALAKRFGTSDDSKLIDAFAGDRAATVEDIINNAEKFAGNMITSYKRGPGVEPGKEVQEEAVEFLKRMKSDIESSQGEEAAAKFNKIVFDKTLRVDDSGGFHDMSGIKNAMDSFLDSAAGTMPGKVFKIRDFREAGKAPSSEFFLTNLTKSDPILAQLTNKESQSTHMNEGNFFRIYDKSYRVEENGLAHVPELDNTYLMSKYGTSRKLLEQMSGNEAYRKKASNALFEKLRIGTEGQPTLIDDVRTAMAKLEDPEWAGNIIPKITKDTKSYADEIARVKAMPDSNEKIAAAASLLNQTRVLNAFYSNNTHNLSKEAALKLAEATDGEAARLLRISAKDPHDLIQEITQMIGPDLMTKSKFRNQDLVSLLREYKTNPRRATTMVSTKENRGNALGGNETAVFDDLMRMELQKEAFLIHSADKGDYTEITKLIENASLSKETERNAKRLADWSVYQNAGGINSRSTRGAVDAESMLVEAEKALNVFIKRENDPIGEYADSMKLNLDGLMKERVSPFDTDFGAYLDDPNVVRQLGTKEWSYMKKAVSPLDLIKGLNDKTTRDSFFKQFTAGRNNMEDVTVASLVPYFFGVRLSDALSKIGMGFDVSDKGSIGALTTAMVTKRGLPIVGAITGYDYLSDMTGVVTGSSMTELLLSGVANTDLAVRGVTDTLGISDFIKSEKELNPLLRYWTGDTYMNQEEREDWYQNGYQAMRKSRWWNFGGISEYRGSEISYFQPNYLRRATSNWKDVSLYDNVWEKWSRSWIPTPTNPISPLVYMANPYWLEQKHADDRPYPMTGKMFTEETPWGPILNATVGEVIKPQKMMHTDRLNENFVDSKMLIEAENKAIYEKARNNENDHLVRFKDGAIEPITYTSVDAPTTGQRVLNFRTYGDELQSASGSGYGDHGGMVTQASTIDYSGSGFGPSGYALEGPAQGIGASPFKPVEGLSAEDELKIKAASGDIGASLVNLAIQNSAMDQISGLNSDIQEKANDRVRMEALGMPDTSRGIITTESIHRAGASFGSSVLKDEEALADLKGLSSGDDFIGEMAYTSRFAAGIYGYGMFAMFPGQPTTKLADASDINSPVRSFWDLNTGGLGGGYFEIFRRFIPAANHKQEDFNPLLNNMEDWMPEKFRFGDPYASLPKGEMRLPGRGYESLHSLHSDQYGTYGAFDRFKILADIAPTSHEYKVWRDIANKTVRDPLLREEMDTIKDRAKEQGKKWDFFNYEFLGRSVDRRKELVDEVIDNNHFTVVGDDRVYKMAGITVGGGDDEQFSLSNYIMSGTEIIMSTDKDEYRGTNDDNYGSINAAVFADGVNVNKQLLDEGYAEKRANDTSAAATMANFTDFQILRGKAWEALSHMPVVYGSQKFFKIRDPLESYKHEMVYGTPFASWSRPIDSFLKPAFERSLMSDTEMLVGLGGMAINKYVHENSENGWAKKIATGAYAFSNRGAFVGTFLGLASGMTGTGLRKAMDAGAIAQGAAWLYTRRDQPIESMAAWTGIGAYVGTKLKKDVGIKKGALVGAITGAIISGNGSNILSDGLDKDWVPERTKEKWKTQEYFDRLTYVKYSGLYEKAARKAERLEGTDINELVDSYEKSREENFELRANLEDAKKIVESAYNPSDQRRQRLLEEIDSKLKSIESSEFSVSVGSYGKSALAYKQAMDSTMYGLGKDASWAELIRSIPTAEREHFMEFMKEKNPERRKEILKVTSPYMQKALKVSWGEEVEGMESNESYFNNMHIPPPTWSGWRPDVDLKDVQVKTIENEGMLLSDFGFYESQLRDANVINAPSLNPDSSNGPATTRARIMASLKGAGLVGVDVNISPSHTSGVEVAANIVSTAINAPQMVANSMQRLLSY